MWFLWTLSTVFTYLPPKSFLALRWAAVRAILVFLFIVRAKSRQTVSQQTTIFGGRETTAEAGDQTHVESVVALTSLPPWPLRQVGSLQGSRKLDKHRCQAPVRLWFVDTVV